VPIKKKARRKYDNSSRAQKSAETQQFLIETYVRLLSQRRGAEVQIQEIAEASGLTTRTIFRFFKDKKSLHQAMETYLLKYLQHGAESLGQNDFIQFARNLYVSFDRHPDLTIAYVVSPFGNEARALLRKKLNQLLIAKIKQERKIKSSSVETQKRLAVVLALINAKVWYDMRIDFEFSGAEMGDTLQWAFEILLQNIGV